MTQGLTFRLTGDKKLLKEMKEKHEKKLVEVHGVLKSDLQPHASRSQARRMRIGIGAPPTGSGSVADEAKRSVPRGRGDDHTPAATPPASAECDRVTLAR